ncbi:MAG: cell division protein FtsA, partial [Candidatus Buchananbacteria bacterium RIFCSPHIGHO2_01_FULL_47_11b]
SSQIKNLTKAVYRPRIDIQDLVLSILATAEAVASSRQKELGVVVINIGGATTSLVVLEEGDVLHTAVIPIGSDHITSDIAIGLRVSIDAAEKIKLSYGSALSLKVSKRDEIDLNEFEGEESNLISKRYVAEIIEARVEEIFDKVDSELRKIDRSGKLPAGAIVTGGGAKLPEIIEHAKKRLRLPASLGVPNQVHSALDKINDPSFSTAVGLVLWGSQATSGISRGLLGNLFSKLPNLKSVAGVVRGWVKKIIP